MYNNFFILRRVCFIHRSGIIWIVKKMFTSSYILYIYSNFFFAKQNAVWLSLRFGLWIGNCLECIIIHVELSGLCLYFEGSVQWQGQFTQAPMEKYCWSQNGHVSLYFSNMNRLFHLAKVTNVSLSYNTYFLTNKIAFGILCCIFMHAGDGIFNSKNLFKICDFLPHSGTLYNKI